MPQIDANVLALVKGEERYIFLYQDRHHDKALRTLSRFAKNPDLSFTWYDAAVLSQKVRQTQKGGSSRTSGNHGEAQEETDEGGK